MKKLMIGLGTITIVVLACSKTNSGMVFTPDCSGTAKNFAADVNPIIQASCTSNSGCHGAGSSNGPGPLLTYQQIFNARISISTAVANGTMPQNGSLSSAQKNTILCWINNGAENN